MRFEFEPGAEEEILNLCDRMFETKLGPMMEDEVKRNTPVDTGSLRDTVAHEVDRTTHTLYVTATGNEEREGENRKFYAAWVDLGHEIVAWGNRTGKFQKPTAFMRRALYRKYPGF